MNSGNQPDINPANNKTLAGTLQFAFYKLMQGVNGMLPARVIAYDRKNNRVQVQLLIAMVTTSGAQVSRPQVASLPVLLLGGGGFFLSFNISEGDLGWVIANDRDISLFLQNYEGSGTQYRSRKEFFGWRIYPGHNDRVYHICIDDTNNAVLQNLDGTVKISFGPDKITVTAPTVSVIASTEADITAPKVVVTASVEADVIAPLIRAETALLAAYGNITAAGTITPGTPPPP